jgi:hypothetical protein
MLNSATRAFLAIALVAVMAGSAVALAVGVNFSPHSSVCIHPIPGSSYQICVEVPPQNVNNVAVGGVDLGKLAQGNLHLTFTNHNKVPVKITVVLRIRTKTGAIRTSTVTITLAPGQAFTLDKVLKGTHIRGATLVLTVTDANGNKAVIKKTVGRFRIEGASAGPHGAIFGPSGHNKPPDKPRYRTVGVGNGDWIYIPKLRPGHF